MKCKHVSEVNLKFLLRYSQSTDLGNIIEQCQRGCKPWALVLRKRGNIVFIILKQNQNTNQTGFYYFNKKLIHHAYVVFLSLNQANSLTFYCTVRLLSHQLRFYKNLGLCNNLKGIECKRVTILYKLQKRKSLHNQANCD